jgi:hypothetical protein
MRCVSLLFLWPLREPARACDSRELAGSWLYQRQERNSFGPALQPGADRESKSNSASLFRPGSIPVANVAEANSPCPLMFLLGHMSSSLTLAAWRFAAAESSQRNGATAVALFNY